MALKVVLFVLVGLCAAQSFTAAFRLDEKVDQRYKIAKFGNVDVPSFDTLPSEHNDGETRKKEKMFDFVSCLRSIYFMYYHVKEGKGMWDQWTAIKEELNKELEKCEQIEEKPEVSGERNESADAEENNPGDKPEPDQDRQACISQAQANAEKEKSEVKGKLFGYTVQTVVLGIALRSCVPM